MYIGNENVSVHSIKTETFNSTLQSSLFILLVMTIFALVGSVTPVNAKDITDIEISTSIVSDLLLDDAVNPYYIDVATSDGIVTFTGTTENLLAKDRATAIASTTVGVRSVVNRLKIKPVISRTDTEIKNSVENALLSDPATDSYEIETSVSNGVVTLSGTVDSWQEKQLSATVAKSIRGVRGIENNIAIDFDMDRLDSEIKPEIERHLANDVRVDDKLIRVEVKDGMVTLNGTVGSLSEKNRAITDAWVNGVRRVNADNLEIKWWERDSMRRKSAYTPKTDEEIKTAVKDALMYDPRVYSFNPEVEVENGTVILNGVVDNLQAKTAAENDARNTVGVWRVKNHLKVQPELIPKDEVLKDRVNKALSEDPYVSKYDVNVTTSFGWVTLSGTVNSSFEDNMAGIVTSRVKGVTGVTNNLEYKHKWTWKPDWELKEDVRDELFWSPYIDEDAIDVSVDKGIVTLDGNVQTWSERLNAENAAWQGGAKDVRNELIVRYQFYGPYPSFFPHLAPDNTIIDNHSMLSPIY